MNTSHHPQRNAREIARSLWRAGYRGLVPVHKNSKKPKGGDDWNIQPEITELEIDRHFEPDDNVGTLDGSPVGGGFLADFDIDDPHVVRVVQLDSQRPRTPATSSYRGKPLGHMFLEVEERLPSEEFKDPLEKNKKKACLAEFRCAPKHDEKGPTYTLLPGSIHPDGQPIVWNGSNGSIPLPAPYTAQALRDYVANAAARGLLAKYWPAEGGRHEACLALAGVFFSAAVPEAEAARIIEIIVKAAPTSSAERVRAVAGNVRDTYASGAKNEPITGAPRLSELIDPRVVDRFLEWSDLGEHLGSGRKQKPHEAAEEPPEEEWPDLIPFGVKAPETLVENLLPGVMGRYAAALARHTETPVVLALLIVLGVVACAVAGKLLVEAETGYLETVIIWVCVLLESGARKTAVVDAARAPLDEFQDEEQARLKPEIDAQNSERKNTLQIVDRMRRRLTNKSTKAEKQEIVDLEKGVAAEAHLPVFAVSDVTAEYLEDVMQENAGRMAIISDEGGMFDVLSGRYNPVPNLDIFLKGHTGGRVSVGRRSRRVFLPHAYLSMCLSPQPIVLQGLKDKPFLRQRGLLARFLYAVPDSMLGKRELKAHSISAKLQAQYRQMIKALCAWKPPSPLRLRLSADALQAWKKFQREVEDRMAPGGELAGFTDWGSKLSGEALRIAGLLARLRDLKTDAVQIEHDDVVYATALATALIPHAIAALGLASESDELTRVKRILKWLSQTTAPKVSRRECFRALQCHFSSVSELEAPLAILTKHGYIRLKSLRSKRSVEIEINPEWQRDADLA